MKSDSELMNELAHKTNYLHEMTSSESSAMKRALLDIYRDVAKLCEKEGLTLMLSGGSCLGAIRHKGFIPWDDDLDVMMRRDDCVRRGDWGINMSLTILIETLMQKLCS